MKNNLNIIHSLPVLAVLHYIKIPNNILFKNIIFKNIISKNLIFKNIVFKIIILKMIFKI